MPGLVGIIPPEISSEDRDLKHLISVATAEMPTNPSWQRHSWTSPTNDCGLVCFARSNASPTTIATSGNATIAFDGELFGIEVSRTEQAKHLLKQYLENGVNELRKIEGRFVAAIWDQKVKQLTLLTDKFGSKPLYYATSKSGFAFGTSITSLRKAVAQSAGMNMNGLVQFFTFGHLWNDDTLYQAIKVAQPAACIQFDGSDTSLSLSQYWRPSLTQRLPKVASLEKIAETLSRSVLEQSRDASGLGVALSGGLDARTMLALVDTNSTNPACVSLGMEGSLDQRTATQLAALANCPYHPLILGQGFLENFHEHMQRMVQLTDGHYLSQCIVMPTFPLYEALGISKLMRGHVGELLHMHKAYNFSTDNEFNGVNNEASLTEWLWTHLQSHLTAGVPEPVLKHVSGSDFKDIGEKSLKVSVDATGHFDHPLDRLSQLFLDQRTHRETAMSLVKFSSVATPRLPYLDSQFISAVFETDPALRIDEDIQAYILRTRRPEFLRPANSNTGAPVGVSSIHRQICYYKMRVLAKLGVKGYQPYERLGLWLKRELQPLVRETLLDERCLDRGVFNPQCVKGVIDRHMKGKANHTYLIMAMMILETGFRQSESGNALPTS